MQQGIPQIELSESAKNHFEQLLQQEEDYMHFRVFVAHPGTPSADIAITFCAEGEQKPDDIPLDFEHFTLYVDAPSAVYLQGAVIDFITSELGAQLSIKAPCLKKEILPIREGIEQILLHEINPQLALHGGFVALVDFTEDTGVLQLQFSGGCHGCGMAKVTLKQGIEKTLKTHYPQITEILDVTDHTTGVQPYIA